MQQPPQKSEYSAAGACLNCIYEMPLRLDEQNPKQALFFPVRGVFLGHDARPAPNLIGGSRLSRPESLATRVGYAKPYWRDSLTSEQLGSAIRVIETLGFGDVFHDDGAVDFSRLR